MATLWVGPNEAYKKLSSAIAASSAGDTINVRAGTYVNDFATVTHALKIVGVGGKAVLQATAAPPNGKAILVTRGNVEIQNLEFTGARVPDENGAGIRHEAGNLTVRDSVFRNNENGILTSDVSGAKVLIEDSTFSGNGRGDARTHGIYVNKVASLVVTGSTFTDTEDGHHIKSRAASTTVEGSTLKDGPDSSVYSIDLANGGTGVIRGNTIHKGEGSLNNHFIGFAGEGGRGGDSLVVENNTFTSDYDRAVLVNNATSNPVRFSGNNASDPDIDRFADGPYTNSGGSSGGGSSGGATGRTVEKSTSYTLGSGEIDLKLLGSSGISGTGNGSDNKITGNSGGNLIKGQDGNDTLLGMGGADTLQGGAGNDRLEGGDGSDILTGGSGKDVLVGGSGSDRFDFNLASESKGSSRDQILDFSRSQGDKIDLAGIDASTKASGNQGFSFLGTGSFTGKAGQLHIKTIDGQHVLEGDVNGDKVADFQVTLNTGSLSSGDFFL
ncbi:right-handed parallel beta-helix repeat-containing protein [Arenibaculum pallidiluteum]|uniref:right-handed parallel beta-helix repeat-containing protein n=1 Tax=Arenibaculum pallidiluteum TaxID=2812559 RepID=UPI001A959EB6|nr:right-handed parallel beta-helix repeat-containing protein [Arenibaculum pallidiluteum]